MCTVFVMCMSVLDVFECVPRCVYSVISMFSRDRLVTGRRIRRYSVKFSNPLHVPYMCLCVHTRTTPLSSPHHARTYTHTEHGC